MSGDQVGTIGLIVVMASAFLITRAGAVDFAAEVSPIFARACLNCHGPAKQKGGLRLDRREDALKGGDHGRLFEAGRAEGALLVQVVEGRHSEIERMPQKGDPLPAEQIALLKRWIQEGAGWPEGMVIVESARADKSWWSLQPLGASDPPDLSAVPAGWKGSIDRFVLAKLREHRLKPSPAADRRTLIRRVSFDVTGLPPAPEEIEAFARDTSPAAYERLVDRLLASPRYGERWGRLWLDVVRFGESNGYERNVLYANAWPYRDYVIRSLNEDKPFDRFILEQLAGDVVGRGDPQVEVATAFLVCGPYDDVGNQDAVAAAQIRANDLDDMVRATSEAVLGLTIGCARCHDHKFDPIPQEDYYRLQAAFAGVRHGERVLAGDDARQTRAERLRPLEEEKARLEKEIAEAEKRIATRTGTNGTREFRLPKIDPYLTEDNFAEVEARLVRFTVLANDRDPKSAGGVRIDEFEIWTAGPNPRNVALAAYGGRAAGAVGRVAEDFSGAYGVELVNDGDFTAKWHAGSPPQLTVSLSRSERISRIVFSSDRPRALPREHGQNTFVGEYQIEVSSDGSNWLSVADSKERPPLNDAFARQRMLRDFATAEDRAELARLESELGKTRKAIAEVPRLPTAWAGSFSQPAEPAYLMRGGDPQRRGPAVAPASPAVLKEVAEGFQLPVDAPESERRLALARWLVHPSNPLTPRVLANRVWQSHFGVGLVDTPSDFGWLGGRPTHPELLEWLAQRLIHHGWRLKPLHREILLSATYQQASTFRSEAASIDRNARYLWRFPPRRLAAEEIRDAMLFVSGRLDLRPGGPGFRLFRYLEDNVATYVPLDTHGPDTYRRAVFHQSPRAARVDLLSDFDCPDNSVAAPQRVSTTSPLQSLTLLNHSFTLDMARFLAEEVEREKTSDGEKTAVRRVFRRTFGRDPTRAESARAIEFVRRHGLTALCRAHFNANEFLHVY